MPLSQEFVTADNKKHDLKNFDCGKPEMNQYLARYAIKNMKLGLSTTWVLLGTNNKSKSIIAAYFTLASSTVSKTEIPLKKTLPGYPIPVVILARLAVNMKYQKQSVGEKTLIYSLRKSLELCDKGLPALGVVLDVLDDDAMKFYSKFKMFVPLTENQNKLFVSMNVIRQI